MNHIGNIQQIIKELDKEELIIYTGNGVEMATRVEKRIILFTHELKRSGAPSVLHDMSKVLLEMGYTVFLVSDEDGELLEEFVECGVNVILYEKLTSDPSWLIKIAEVFPDIIVNTMVSVHLTEFLVSYAENVYWWIHEAEVGIRNWAERIKNVPRVPQLVIWAASPLIQKNIREYWGRESELLNFYIEDVPAVEFQKKDRLNIINVGDVNGNKGQDIIKAAYEMLDECVRDKFDLYFCGDNQRYNKELLLEILDFVDENENVHLLEGMAKEDLYQVYDEVDIVLVASYYESTSAVAVEGLMKGKLCICTETCGVCEYLENEKSAFMFKCGDAGSLAKVLEKVILNYKEYEYIRRNGRGVYEKIYTKKVFQDTLKKLLKK